MGRSKRRAIAPNVYQDATGIDVVARLGPRTKAKRLPLDASKDLIARTYADCYQALLDTPASAPTTAKLLTDIDTAMNRLGHLAEPSSLRAHLRAWAHLFPTLTRRQLTRSQVLEARSRWMAAGLTPKTINNRVSALRTLYHVLDGDDAPTPADRIKPLPIHRTPAVSVDVQTILAVDRALQERERHGFLRDAKTRARFRVLASTGRRPSEVMRAQPTDVDLTRRVWTVRDGKGGFSPGIYLTDDMMAAWHLFMRANAWGPFDTYSVARVLRHAGWPASVRPYNLRHSIGIALSEAGVDLADVQAMLGHKHIQTTRKHYVPVRQSRMQAASRQLDGRLPWTDER